MSVRMTQNGTARLTHPGLVRSHHRMPGPCHSVPGASRVQSRDRRVNPTTPGGLPMMMLSVAPKIRPDHLDRLALVYVRQSTMIQVRENTASAARQYDLAGRARDLGWPPERIQVIDQDQGHSGASSAGRDGFQHLVAQVGLGRTGAVLSLEASRLARSCSDWYRLIEICALTNTLVIDEDGVYDPTHILRPSSPGIPGNHERGRTTLASFPPSGRQAEEGIRGPTPVPAAYGAGLRSRGPDRLRSRRTGPAGSPADLRPVRAVDFGLGRRPTLRRPSPPVPHSALGWRPTRSSDLETAEPWPCPGHPAQSRVRGRLRLWPHQDSPPVLAR